MPKDLYEIISIMAKGGILETGDISEEEFDRRVNAARARKKRKKQRIQAQGPVPFMKPWQW